MLPTSDIRSGENTATSTGLLTCISRPDQRLAMRRKRPRSREDQLGGGSPFNGIRAAASVPAPLRLS